ncbi:MAG: hypothetical protein RL885_01570 [Planctomycetota bacterium]
MKLTTGQTLYLIGAIVVAALITIPSWTARLLIVLAVVMGVVSWWLRRMSSRP